MGNYDGACLQMDLLVLHTHHEDPVQVVGGDRRLHQMPVQQRQDQFSNFLPVILVAKVMKPFYFVTYAPDVQVPY